jgi:hypothetical protein
MPNRSSRPTETDPNRLAFLAVQKVIEAGEGQPSKDPLAVELGRRGGLKGGKARSASLSPARRKAIARKGAKARWGTRRVKGTS